MRNWLITGATSGLGLSIARKALENGDRVAVTSRKNGAFETLMKEYPDKVLPLVLHLDNRLEIAEVVKKTIEIFGTIDVLVNNAGYIQLGAMEETSEKEARDEMEILFWGQYYMTKEILPYMRKQQGGTIVQVSSLAGIGGLPGNTMYAAAKHALEGMSKALSFEVKSFGIRVLLLQPCGIKTGLGSSIVMSTPMEEYRSIMDPQRNRWVGGKDDEAEGDPDLTAEALMVLLDSDEMPLRFLCSANGEKLGRLIYNDALSELDKWSALSRSITPGAE